MNIVFSILILFIGLLGGYLITKKFSYQKELVYKVAERGTFVPKAKIPAGKIKYNDEEIDSLSYIDVFFANIGRSVIDNRIGKEPSDVENPVRIVFPQDAEGKILEAYVIDASRKEIKLQADKKSTRDILVKFDFLDNKDGGTIKILHTFMPSVSFELDSTIIGLSKGVRPYEPSLFEKIIEESVIGAILKAVLLLFPLWLGPSLISNKIFSFSNPFITTLSIVIFASYGLFWAWLVTHLEKRYKNRKLYRKP